MAQARVLERLPAAAGLEGQTPDAQPAWRPRTPFGSGLWGHTPAGTVSRCHQAGTATQTTLNAEFRKRTANSARTLVPYIHVPLRGGAMDFSVTGVRCFQNSCILRWLARRPRCAILPDGSRPASSPGTSVTFREQWRRSSFRPGTHRRCGRRRTSKPASLRCGAAPMAKQLCRSRCSLKCSPWSRTRWRAMARWVQHGAARGRQRCVQR